MRRTTAMVLAGICLLSACAPDAEAPASGALPASSIAGPDHPFWKDTFAPVSNAPELGPGDLAFAFAGFGRPGALQFGKGLVLQTEPVRQPRPGEAYTGRASETWADLLGLPADGQVEIRRVLSEAEPLSSAGGLCGADPTTYVAIGIGPGINRPGPVSIAGFAGAEAPGSRSTVSEVCNVYQYAAPG